MRYSLVTKIFCRGREEQLLGTVTICQFNVTSMNREKEHEDRYKTVQRIVRKFLVIYSVGSNWCHHVAKEPLRAIYYNQFFE